MKLSDVLALPARHFAQLRWYWWNFVLPKSSEGEWVGAPNLMDEDEKP